MKTVLLIDDDQALRNTIATWLSENGWQVLQAEDGETGLQMALEQKPDVVLCDLLMPRCNGFQFCRTIRKQREQLPYTKIIVTTGSGYPNDRINAMDAGADDYLVKPIVLSELVEMLGRITRNGGISEAGEDAATLRASSPVGLKPLPRSEIPIGHPPRLKFWGVRGSIPKPGPSTVFYGGNTACVEVRADGQIIILDAGTGIHSLGVQLTSEFQHQPIDITLLISHTHWDHIQGFPFFQPAYNPKNNVRILGYEGARQGLDAILSSQMESPYFPIGFHEMPGHVTIEELKELTFNIGKVKVQAAFLNHPGICMGYRLFTSGGSIAYLPDNEPFQRFRSLPSGASASETTITLKYAQEQDQKLIDFISESDVVIIDAQYDDAEYQTHVGWGHGCVDDVVALALMARVKRLFLFHHDPEHDDAQIGKMESWARELVAMHNEVLAVEAAREGVEIVLATK